MPIQEVQLITWSHQGALTTAKSTHESIRNALISDSSPIRHLVISGDVEIYLQGSYKNETNIRGDSDVDVVVQLNSSFHFDDSNLNVIEKLLFDASYNQSTYLWRHFRNDVLLALQAYFGESNVKSGEKSIKVKAGSNRLPTDVVVCVQHRRYQSFTSIGFERYQKGIAFYSTLQSKLFVNYPKDHYDRGVAKNKYVTFGRYKPTIRIFKNLRNVAIDSKILEEDWAPSYFIECLLFNVPAASFVENHEWRVYNILEWLHKAQFDNFMCQNGIVRLFGPSENQWSIPEARRFLNGIIDVWNNWN